jgi:hypothetical protein
MEENLDEKTLHELEDVLGTRIYPGTEIMKDVGTHHFVKSSGKSVLVPQPSDDRRDPLNWSPFWKAVTIFAATAFAFAQSLGPLALAPMFQDYIEEWKCSLADAVQFTGKILSLRVARLDSQLLTQMQASRSSSSASATSSGCPWPSASADALSQSSLRLCRPAPRYGGRRRRATTPSWAPAS